MADFDSGFDAVRRADRVIDALASGRRVPSNDPADLAVASMLAHWRDDIRRGPVPELVSTRQAAAALGRTARAHRNRFVPTVVGAVAAAMLCLGGFGAVLYDAHPGDTLYGLRTLVFGEAPAAREANVALAAQSQLMEVQQLIQQGQWQQAQDKLAAASTAVRNVPDLQNKQALIDQMNQLTVKVETRDPNASLPPGAPPPPPLPGMVVPLPNIVEAPVTATETTMATTTTTAPSTGASTAPPSSTTPTTMTAPPSQTVAVPPPPPTITMTIAPPPTITTTTTPSTKTATATATAPALVTTPVASPPQALTTTSTPPSTAQAPAMATAQTPAEAPPASPNNKQSQSSGPREVVTTTTTPAPKPGRGE